MMATEATSDNIATPSIISNNELSTTETPSHHVPSDETHPLLNGTTETTTATVIEGGKQDPEPVESGAISAEVSVNGGSDTEASKAETTKLEDDEKGHARTASTVKKFASFKPVSVNKKFLAAKGPATATSSKPGEATAGANTAQTGALASATLRPRLVAKSGSGLRDSAPRAASGANGGKSGAAPDASAVWNKNRPAPPPEPKRMTDEELKQQYGIHLATRLESDAPGRQANWADIDDDDDDWAPETIEWTDGTKITLPSADDPPREPSPIPVLQPVSIEIAKPKSPAPTHASSSPSIKPSGFGGRTGLILKGAAEKPTLVAKPPGPPTPVKSPWAPLPPVDKVAPVAIDTPNQQTQQGRFAQRDPHGFHGMPPPPAKEIAADDFSRAGWRGEGNLNANRELFNSQSGRYEPVNDRRGPHTRNEGHSRQPAVLQRPSGTDGPAEPSPAFQTHHTSSQNAGFSRRRTSSNVSGGSGNFTRRMSKGHDMPPPHEMLGVRRGSLAAVSDEPASPRNYSPSGQYQRQAPQWQARSSPVASHPSPNSVYNQPIPPASTTTDGQAQAGFVSVDDVFEAQKKEMREKRELAIKRRQEEETKEEAARKERIRIKLEAMGPLPEKKDKKEEKPIPTQIQTREAADMPSSTNAASELPKVKISENAGQQITSSADAKLTEQTPNNDLRPSDNQGSGAASTMQAPQETRAPQSWQNKSPSTWAPPPGPQSSSNVWGPPSNNRTLGNGTFNPELSSASRPSPIGPPNRQYQGRGGRDYPSSRVAPIGPPSSRPPQDPSKMAPGWGDIHNKLKADDEKSAMEALAERTRKEQLREQGLLQDESRAVYKEVFRQTVFNDGARSKLQAKESVVRPTGAEEDTAQPSFDPRQTMDTTASEADYPQFNEAWKPAAPPLVRPSRFFNNNRDVRLEDSSISFNRPGSPSPPPPTMEDHPAYAGGDIRHPHINFPKPAPVVRLPPTLPTPIGPPKQHSTPAQRHPQDIRLQPSLHGAGGELWMEKINGLFTGGHNHKDNKDGQVKSQTKNALDLRGDTTVSLPAAVSGILAQDPSSVTSKPASTRCFEEPEMGSLPVVKVPTKAPANGWSPFPAPEMTHENVKEVTSSNTFVFEVEKPTKDEHTPHGSTKISIRLPGQENTVKVNVAPPRQRSNRGRGGNRGSRQSSSSHRGSRPRGAPSGLSSPIPSDSTPTHLNRGRRGNLRDGPSRGGHGRGGSNTATVDHTGYNWAAHPPAIAS